MKINTSDAVETRNLTLVPAGLRTYQAHTRSNLVAQLKQIISKMGFYKPQHSFFNSQATVLLLHLEELSNRKNSNELSIIHT